MTHAAGANRTPFDPPRDADVRERIAVDPQRPIYHFVPEANWLNDPNGLIRWKGQYHLFYQYNPNGPFHGTIHWGHAVSADLVHWRHLPIALAPTPGGPDQDGCYSGCAVNADGVATLIYTGVRGSDQLACIATSTDDLLLDWEKSPQNPVIATPPPGLDLVAYRDHSAWKEGDTWFQVIGAGICEVGGAALLYRSPDLRRWEYMHPLCVGDRHSKEPIWTGTMWECPDFFRLDGNHALIVSVWNEHQLHYPAYFVGTYAGHRFTPESAGLVDLGSSFYAPQSMTDDLGRRIMFGWLRERRDLDAQRRAGWSGVMSLPRVLSLLPGGVLGIEPAPEVAHLRGQRYSRHGLAVQAGSSGMLPDVRGAHLQIVAEWERGAATMAGLKLCCTPDGAEETLVGYDYAERRLFVDRSRSSHGEAGRGDLQEGTLELPPGEQLHLDVFLDGSVVEVFANGRACLTERIYPTRPDSFGLDLFAMGGETTLQTLDVYEMRSA